jgi:hypothetical protein
VEATFGPALVAAVVKDCQMVTSKDPAGLAWTRLADAFLTPRDAPDYSRPLV